MPGFPGNGTHAHTDTRTHAHTFYITAMALMRAFVSLGAGPPYPPNQFGGGRGNYDNFRGHGSGFPGKQRNNRYVGSLLFPSEMFPPIMLLEAWIVME